MTRLFAIWLALLLPAASGPCVQAAPVGKGQSRITGSPRAGTAGAALPSPIKAQAEHRFSLPSTRAYASPGINGGVPGVVLAPTVVPPGIESRGSPPAPALKDVPGAGRLDALLGGISGGSSLVSEAEDKAHSQRGPSSLQRLKDLARERTRGIDWHGIFDNGRPQEESDWEPTGLPTRIVVGPRTFKVGELADLITPGLQKRVRAIKDPKERDLFIRAHTPNEPFDIRWVLEREMGDGLYRGKKEDVKRAYRNLMRRVKYHEKKAPGALRQLFFDTLDRYEHKVEEHRGFKVYEIGRGIEFWNDLLHSKDGAKSVAGRLFLRSQARRSKQDYPVRVLTGLREDLKAVTQILDASRLTPEELAILEHQAKEQGLDASRLGDHILVGGGISYFLARQIVEAASRLKEPALIERFERVLRYLAGYGIPMVYDQNQGAAAYYSPLEDKMAYVMPSRGDLNATAHEVNHARFQNFQESLSRWIQKKGYAVPYEIDGPQYALLGTSFGGFMNLLNELNSWRIGESFEGGKSDAEILKILRRAYGRQAGSDNVRLFSAIWTAKRVQGKSVPSLILARVRALNALSDEEVTALGREALREDDIIKAHNFMRLVFSRRPRRKEIPAKWQALLRKLVKNPDEGVAEVARNILGIPQPESQDDGDEEESEAKDISEPKESRAQKVGRIAALLKSALTENGGKDKGRQERALRVFEKALDQWGLEAISAEGKNRPIQRDHVLFDPRIDRLLARRMFDGRKSVHRLGLVNLIRTRTYPEELPELNKRLLQVIADDGVDPDDLWLARMFLVPENNFDQAHLAWGEGVVEAVRRDKTPSVSAMEFSGEYYRLALGGALPGSPWGEWARTKLDAKLRRESLQALQKLSPLERRRYERALSRLWGLLAHEDARVRTSARYAIAGYPGYLLGLEDRIVRCLQAKTSKRRPEVLRLIAMTRKGFLPKVDEALKAYR